MKRSFRSLSLLIALAAVCTAASATFCGPGTVHSGQPEPWYPDRCNEGAGADPGASSRSSSHSSSNSAAAAAAASRSASQSAGGAATVGAVGGGASDQRQQQQQQTQQQQQQRVQAGNGAGAGSGIVTIEGAQAGSGAQTNIRESTVFMPSPAVTQASIAVPGQITTREGACGPLKIVLRTPMVAIHHGAFGGRDEIYQGDHYDTADMQGPSGEPIGFRRVRLSDTETIVYGHRKVYSRTVLTGSSLAHLNISGWGSSGGGSAGGGGSAAVTKFGTEIDLEDCEVGREVRRTVLIAPSPIMMPVVRKPKPRVIKKPDPCIATALAQCRVPLK